MSRQLLAFGLFLWSLLVLVPEPTTAFTVKLLGNDNTFGEVHVEALDKANRVPIPNGNDVFPAQNGNNITRENVDFPTSDEISLEISVGGAMTKDEIDAYLIHFGYLAPLANGSVSEEERKEALREFQRYANLDETGVMDNNTMKQMQRPRCGLADPVSHSKVSNFNAKGSRKWDKKELTYRIIEFSKKVSKSLVRETVEKAFQMWSDVSQLIFTEVLTGTSNLKLRFSSRIHGDGANFDGPGGVLAHAFYPKNGEIHMDEEEKWSVQSKKGINLLFVLVHEIGHAIGLGHSKVKGAIMGPYYHGYQPNLVLDNDDIAGIQFLYGKSIVSTVAPPTPNPTTKAVTTKAMTTKVPTTKAPTTMVPTTKTSATKAPTTKALTTKVPTTKFPTTVGPTTKVPTTKALSTKVPTTKAPTTMVPTTKTPATKAPTTEASTTENAQTNYPYSTTLQPVPTEPTPPRRKFPCPFRFWATMTAGNRTYGFYRRYVYEILPNGKIRRRRSIKSFFPKGPRIVGAAAHNEITGHTFLFWGKNVFRYTDRKIDRGFPKKLKNFIRAAVVVYGQLIAFSFRHIHYLDEDTMEEYVDGEVTIKDEYPGLPYGIRAAVSYGDGLAYILYWKKVIQLDMYTGEMTEKICYKK